MVSPRFANLMIEVGQWSHNNFGDQISKWMGFRPYPETMPDTVLSCRLFHVSPLMGIIEECGEMAEALEQLRPDQSRDAMADVLIYLADYLYRIGEPANAAMLDWDYIDERLDIESSITEPGQTCRILLQKIGRLMHINLKRHQGIRGWGDNSKFFLALGGALEEVVIMTGRMMYYVHRQKMNREKPFTVHDLLDIAFKEWNHVKQRNWKLDTAKGGRTDLDHEQPAGQ